MRDCGTIDRGTCPPCSLDGLRPLGSSRTALREQLGAGAYAAADGVTALRVLRTAAARGHAYAFALIDATMPGMDGFELAGRIASDPALSATRLVLLVTAAPAGGRSHPRPA